MAKIDKTTGAIVGVTILLLSICGLAVKNQLSPFEFNIGQNVIIIEAGIHGIVLDVSKTIFGSKYLVYSKLGKLWFAGKQITADTV